MSVMSTWISRLLTKPWLRYTSRMLSPCNIYQDKLLNAVNTHMPNLLPYIQSVYSTPFIFCGMLNRSVPLKAFSKGILWLVLFMDT